PARRRRTRPRTYCASALSGSYSRLRSASSSAASSSPRRRKSFASSIRVWLFDSSTACLTQPARASATASTDEIPRRSRRLACIAAAERAPGTRRCQRAGGASPAPTFVLDEGVAHVEPPGPVEPAAILRLSSADGTGLHAEWFEP